MKKFDKMNKTFVTSKREVFFEMANQHISGYSLVLDIGSGEGAFADYCKRKDFYLFDGNLKTVDNLKKRFPNVFYGELPKLPFESGFFDLIHCSHVVEHLEPQIFYDTLREMDRCLKAGGILVISSPLMWNRFFDDLSHVKPYQPVIYEKYLTNTNTINTTRTKISWDYVILNLEYRYYERTFTDYF